MRDDLLGLTDRVLKLEINAAKGSKSVRGSDAVTAIIAGFAGLIAALIGGGMTLLSQRITAKRERERAMNAARLERDLAVETAQREADLARESAQHQLELARKVAIFQQTEKILEFRLKQMELFYAPMFALLEQSKALTIKLYRSVSARRTNTIQTP